MATQEDVRRIAMVLPETEESTDRFGFSVRAGAKSKSFVWSWLERIDPKKARVPSDRVVAVRVANLEEKNLLLSMDERVLFTEPHYNGYPAVLIRLDEVSVDQLEQLIIDAWRCQAPKALVRAFDARLDA